MSVTLFSFVAMYSKGLATLEAIVRKARAYAADNGIGEEDMLRWRLVEDMFPLWRQAQIVANFGARWPARAAGLEEPPEATEEVGFDELLALIERSKLYVADLTPDQFDAQGGEILTLNLGVIEPSMPMEQWITGFATTNFYFHLSMAYAILRQRGVPLGKADLFAGGL